MKKNRSEQLRIVASLTLCTTLVFSIVAFARDATAQGAARGATQGSETAATDSRHRLELPPQQRDVVLLEMRTMLESVNEILLGLTSSDSSAMERAARKAGLTMAADVDPLIQSALPQEFLLLGMRTHKAFDELAEQIAGGGDTEEILQGLSSITGNCVGCHAAFRLDEKR